MEFVDSFVRRLSELMLNSRSWILAPQHLRLLKIPMLHSLKCKIGHKYKPRPGRAAKYVRCLDSQNCFKTFCRRSKTSLAVGNALDNSSYRPSHKIGRRPDKFQSVGYWKSLLPWGGSIRKLPLNCWYYLKISSRSFQDPARTNDMLKSV